MLHPDVSASRLNILHHHLCLNPIVRHATPPDGTSSNSHLLPMSVEQNSQRRPKPRMQGELKLASSNNRFWTESARRGKTRQRPASPTYADFQHVMVQDPFGPCRHHCACVSGMLLPPSDYVLIRRVEARIRIMAEYVSWWWIQWFLIGLQVAQFVHVPSNF